MLKSFIFLSFLLSAFILGQNNLKNLRGNVTDFYKNPLQGVIVILKNESKFEYRKEAKPDSGDIIVPAMSLSPLSMYAGGETNIYGDYNFPVSYGEHILEISYPGFKTVLDTILVTKDTWDVHSYQLEVEYFDLEEITVNVPYTYLDNNYIKSGEEFRYGISINSKRAAYDLGRFKFQCIFISDSGSSYTFKIDSFGAKYQKDAGIITFPTVYPVKIKSE